MLRRVKPWSSSHGVGVRIACRKDAPVNRAPPHDLCGSMTGTWLRLTILRVQKYVFRFGVWPIRNSNDSARYHVTCSSLDITTRDDRSIQRRNDWAEGYSLRLKQCKLSLEGTSLRRLRKLPVVKRCHLPRTYQEMGQYRSALIESRLTCGSLLRWSRCCWSCSSGRGQEVYWGWLCHLFGLRMASLPVK